MQLRALLHVQSTVRLGKVRRWCPSCGASAHKDTSDTIWALKVFFKTLLSRKEIEHNIHKNKL